MKYEATEWEKYVSKVARSIYTAHCEYYEIGPIKNWKSKSKCKANRKAGAKLRSERMREAKLKEMSNNLDLVDIIEPKPILTPKYKIRKIIKKYLYKGKTYSRLVKELVEV